MLGRSSLVPATPAFSLVLPALGSAECPLPAPPNLPLDDGQGSAPAGPRAEPNGGDRQPMLRIGHSVPGHAWSPPTAWAYDRFWHVTDLARPSHEFGL